MKMLIPYPTFILHLVGITILMFVGSRKSNAQKFTFEVDTIYSRYYTYKDAIILFKKDFKSIVAKENSIEEYPVKIQRLLGGNFRGFNIAQVGSKCYLLNEDLEFNSTKFIHLKLKELSHSRQHFLVSNSKAAYVKNDSIFIADFDTHETSFIKSESIVMDFNESYLYIKSTNSEEGYIYILKSNELKKLPDNYNTPVTDHCGFIRNKKFGKGLELLDLNFTRVIKGDEGYTESTAKGDLLIIYGNQKPIRIFYRDKEIFFQEEYFEVFYNAPSLFFLRNKSNKIAAFNTKGEMLSKAIYDEVTSSITSIGGTVLKNGNTIELYDNSFNLLVSGEYTFIEYLFPNRMLVRNNTNDFLLIDSTNTILKTYDFGYFEKIEAIDEFGKKIFKITNGKYATFYDFDGVEIVSWVNEVNDEYTSLSWFRDCYNWKMLHSLPDDQEKKINPAGVWIKEKKVNGVRLYNFCKKNGVEISPSWRLIIPIGSDGLYLVKTKQKKIGILRIEN